MPPLVIGPRAPVAFTPADILDVDVGGEWAARRELIRKNLLVWFPASLDETRPPLDFEKDILDIWIARRTTDDLRASGNTYTGLGKTLEALVIFAKDTGDSALAAEMHRIVKAVCASQDADGYLGTVRRGSADPDTALWQVWNVHDGAYLAKALLEYARLFNHPEVLASARRYGDYLMRVWDKAPKRPGALSPVGITDFFFALSDATGDRRYLDFIADTPFDGRFIGFASLRDWRQELYPIRNAKQAGVGGDGDALARNIQAKVHSYRYFARLIDQLELHGRLAPPDAGLFEMSRYTLEKIADADAPGVFITGANARGEGWVEDQIGHGTVGEGCAVVHMVWWLAKLIESDGDLAYADWIERAILNHIEASQHPVSGRLRYDCHLSGARNFAKLAHCCDGNHRRFWAHLERLIYYTFPGGLAVSLYTPSTARLIANGIQVTLAQQTAYPADGKIDLRIEPEEPVAFSLRLRVPRWAATHALRVNGQRVNAQTAPGGGIAIERRWQQGDRVTLEVPMEFRWIDGMKGYAGHAALMRGPQVFALAANRNPALVGTADWRRVKAAPASVRLLPSPPADGARQPIEASVKAWPTGARTDGEPPLEIVFSDFPAPDGRETYVTLSDPAAAKRDPLLAEPDGQIPSPPTSKRSAPHPSERSGNLCPSP
ncbi:MAG: glycoside hydrolase family 127 protein [Verrucomicrobiae bacterium]|nr:glycoside hydrolase family 127 protein [Verrucomicrobiae bacterium]